LDVTEITPYFQPILMGKLQVLHSLACLPSRAVWRRGQSTTAWAACEDKQKPQQHVLHGSKEKMRPAHGK
jgi:hypothetical protein